MAETNGVVMAWRDRLDLHTDRGRCRAHVLGVCHLHRRTELRGDGDNGDNQRGRRGLRQADLKRYAPATTVTASNTLINLFGTAAITGGFTYNWETSADGITWTTVPPVA